MKWYIALAVHLLMVLCIFYTSCTAGAGDGGILFSPLYKYRAYPLLQVISDEALEVQRVYSTYQGYQTTLDSHNGIISNSVYPQLSGSNVVYLSNGNPIAHFDLSAYSNCRILTANAKYAAILDTNTLIVLDSNAAILYSQAVATNLFIAALGNGSSSLLAYGEVTEMITNPWEIIYSNYPAGHYLKLLNVESRAVTTLPNAYGISGFSRNNKYLFYTYYTGRWYWYSVAGQETTPPGPLMCYDILAGRNIAIGETNYDIYTNYRTGTGWNDTINGVREDLKGFYVTELASGQVISSRPLDDGRSCWAEGGLWYVDISSLGLSE